MDTGLGMGLLRTSLLLLGQTVRLGRVIKTDPDQEVLRRWASPSLRPNGLERQTGQLGKLGKWFQICFALTSVFSNSLPFFFPVFSLLLMQILSSFHRITSSQL